MSGYFEYGAVSNAELLVFLLDGSGSMRSKTTDDGKEKNAHLDLLVKDVLERLSKGSMAPAFRVAIIRFGFDAVIEQVNGSSYYNLNDALTIIKPSVSGFAPDEGTDMVNPIKEAVNVINSFHDDEGMPADKAATVFLFTDGKHNESLGRDVAAREVAEAIGELRASRISPTIAAISFGSDADKDLLLKISSEATEKQKKRLDNENMLDYIIENHLLVEGHVNDQITRTKAEVIRNFVITLSATVKS
jgi:von Willebrand factor type A domain